MRSRATFGFIMLLLALIAVVLPPVSAQADPGDTNIVDVAYDGTETDGSESVFPAFSADGNLVAYRSNSRNLIGPPPPGSSGQHNLYVHNRATGVTERITNTYNGTEFSGEVNGPGISGNGRFIAYVTNAQSVTPDDHDQGPSLFLYDRQSQTTQYITGALAFNANEPTSISGNGRYILYQSSAFQPGRTFIYDRVTGMSTHIATGVTYSQMSRDGNWVVFGSQSRLTADDTNVHPDIFLYNVQSSETTLVSKPPNTPDQSNGWSDYPAVNADGSVIAFWSQATTLVGTADTNDVSDIFVYDRTNNTMERANVGPGGVQGDLGSYYTPSLDSSGDRVTFMSCDTTLLVNPADENGYCDVYVRDRSSGETLIASVSSSGEMANEESVRPAISPDGSVVAFSSRAWNLAQPSSEDNLHLYTHELGGAVSATSDLEVTTSVQGAGLAYAGYDLEHTVQVGNLGPEDANSVSVTAALPSGSAFSSVTTDRGSCANSSGTITCNVGALPNGVVATITIVATPTLAGTTTYAASATTTSTDSNTGNNEDSTSVDVGGQDCTIVGTQANNPSLSGTIGNDVICGLGGNDTVSGLDGADVLVGGSGADNLMGGAHNDWLIGGAGNDGLNGGAGTDLARYDASPAPVTASIGSWSATGEGSDFMTTGTIEGLVGSSLADTLIGNNNAQSLTGLGGSDSLDGSGGNDVIKAGPGNDGLLGGAGNDWLHGQSGDDSIDGGVGTDLARFDDAPGPVTASLTSLTATGEGSDTFVLNSLEGLVGSPFDDSFTGSDRADALYPLGGNDILSGLAGGDRLEGGSGNDSLSGGTGSDNLLGQAGDDTFDGGTGVDWVRYEGAPGDVSASLTSLSATGGDGNDTFVAGTIENLAGSLFNDTLTGDGLANRLEGGNGNDSLYGLAGVDILLGGNGNDLLNGGLGNDVLGGGAGTDSCIQGGGSGSVSGCP